jgi:hydroxymethylpyrimidine/phosphomethylpyrimidine kinase
VSSTLSPVLQTTSSRLVAIGGLDPTGGAGLVRDAATARALGWEVVLIGTAWTDQSRHGVRGFEGRDPASLRDAAVRALPGAAAVKIGMVATPELVEAILAALTGFPGPVVFDPVIGASSGGALFEGAAHDLLPLVQRATLTTPNLAEAAALTGLPVGNVEEARAAARALVAGGAPAVLVKGGHLEGAAIDLLATDRGEEPFTAERIPGPSPRGTGCALATALAVELGRGRALRAAVGEAKRWLHRRIREARMVGEELMLGD